MPWFLYFVIYGTLCFTGRSSLYKSNVCVEEPMINYYWAVILATIMGLFFSFPKSKLFTWFLSATKYFRNAKSKNKFYYQLKSYINTFFWSFIIILIFFSPSYLYVTSKRGPYSYFLIVSVFSIIYATADAFVPLFRKFLLRKKK